MILVTGATGNVGAELVGELAAAGAPVRVLVRRQDAKLPNEVQRAVGDLNQPNSVAPALRVFGGCSYSPAIKTCPVC
jgi:uncharacterized protein YbjT (DUF2867 family)